MRLRLAAASLPFPLLAVPAAVQAPRFPDARLKAAPKLRGQALLWLRQTHDPRALAFFRQLLDRSKR